MPKDINFKKISRKELIERQEVLNSIVENENLGIVDKKVDRQDIVNVYDKTFFNDVMLKFESKQEVNSCFMNDFTDRNDSDMTNSINVQIDPINTCLKLIPGNNYGEYYTKEIYNNQTPNSSTMNGFYLIVDSYVTRSTTIMYYLVTDKNDVFSIEPNNKVPFNILDDGRLPNSVRLKIVINQGNGNFDYIKGIALLYNDSLVSSQLDIFNPNFNIEAIETPEDMVILYRDPKNNDALYKVESIKDTVMINYSPNGDLSHLDVYDTKSERMTSKVEMIYQDYTNSSNVTEKVLTRIRTRNSFSDS